MEIFKEHQITHALAGLILVSRILSPLGYAVQCFLHNFAHFLSIEPCSSNENIICECECPPGSLNVIRINIE